MNNSTEENAPERHNETIKIGQIIEKDYGPELWLVDKLIPYGGITAIAGDPGSYKTFLSLEIAKCVAADKPLFGQFKVQAGGVLFLDKENGFRHLQKRLKQLGITADLSIQYMDRAETFMLDDTDDFKDLLEIIEREKISLVVFDSLIRFHSGDENEARSMARIMNMFKALCAKGATVVFLHHTRKEGFRAKKSANSMRGSGDIHAGIDSLLLLNKKEKGSVIIDQAKARWSEEERPFSVNIKNDKEKDTVEFIYEGEHDSTSEEKEEIKVIIKEQLKENKELSRQDFLEILDKDSSTPVIDKSLNELVESGEMEKRKGAHGKLFFSLKQQVKVAEAKPAPGASWRKQQ